MAITLERLALSQSRLSEYFSAKELAMQIGGDQDAWPLILVKELIDNSLDACEAHIPPVIEVEVQGDHFRVTDNGPGLPSDVLLASLDYSQRISTKAAYVSPTRGRLGNALKVLWAAPFVAHGGEPIAIVVDTPVQRHAIHVGYDAIRQTPTITCTQEPPTVKIGTSVMVPYPALASLLAEGGDREFLRIFSAFAAANPHATLRWRIGAEQGEHTATTPDWRKWSVTKPTPVQWYTPDQFSAYIAAHLANGHEALTLRQFVAQFAGLSSTIKQKDVVATAKTGTTLVDLLKDGKIDGAAAYRLYTAMSAASTPPKPMALGIIGKEHLKAWMESRGTFIDFSFAYRKATMELAGKPVVMEVAFGLFRDFERLETVELVNWSAPVIPPFSLRYALEAADIGHRDPAALVISLAMADARFSDHGKARLELPGDLLVKLHEMIVATAKIWTKFKANHRRKEQADARRWEREIAATRDKEMTAKAACQTPGIMKTAYLKASGNGQYPANARQIMYAIRPVLLELMGKEQAWKNDSTFTQGILPDYITDHPDETADWDVVYDDRGHFDEPFTGRGIGLGTVAVRDYIGAWGDNEPETDIGGWRIERLVSTAGPANRFQYALFIEKEGFASLLKAAQFAERYDLAIFSTKGMSVTAARMLVEALSEVGVTILALHDFDKAGIKIRHTLCNDTRRYIFKTKPHVIDLGLRLEDIAAMQLDPEPVLYGTRKNPRLDILASGGTQADANYLVRDGGPGDWQGYRVELNAMTADQFVTWLDSRLLALGIDKVIPSDEVLAKAYIRAQRLKRLEREVFSIVAAINAEPIIIPPDLLTQISDELDAIPGQSWDAAIAALVESDPATDPPNKNPAPVPPGAGSIDTIISANPGGLTL